MWGLEHLLLFGLPENKLEVFDGKTRCVFPFLDRVTAEAHFGAWLENLSRWRGAPVPAVADRGNRREAEIDGVTLTLFPLPIELRFPLDVDTLLSLQRPFWRRDLWEAQPPGHEDGWDRPWDHSDVTMNLWRFFEAVVEEVGGQHCGRVGLVLPDAAAVEPDHYYFGPGRKPRTIHGDFIWDVPDLVAEVLSPAARVLDRGPRMEIYRRAGVAHLWLLDPLIETLEVYALDRDRYARVSTLRAGESYRSPLFPEVPVVAGDLFDTQSKRHVDLRDGESEPIPDWLVPREKSLGLEYMLLVGHPERRYEVWGDRAPCVLVFGSSEEASARLRDFLGDACRWESMPSTKPLTIEPDLEVAEIGRFRFARRGRQVHLDVAVQLEEYRLMLESWATREAWDWGGDD